MSLVGWRRSDGGALADAVENQLALANRTDPALQWECLHAIDGFSVHDHFALSRYLQEKDLAFVGGSIAVGELLDEKYAAILVELDFAIDEIGNGDLDRGTASLLRDLVDDFLGEGMKQERAVSLACTGNRMQALAPASPVLFLAVSPGPYD